MMKLATIFCFWCCCLVSILTAQTHVELTTLPQADAPVLADQFKDFQTVELDFEALYRMHEAATSGVKFSLQTTTSRQLDFNLIPYSIRAASYHRQTMENGRVIRKEADRNAMYRGTVGNTNPVEALFTFDRQYTLGRWEENGTIWFLEPLWRFDPAADRNHYVLYREQDAIIPEDFCATHIPAQVDKIKEKSSGPEKLGECLEVEIALASDFELFQDFGNDETSVENFMLNNLANVQTNYDDEFDDELQYVVVTTFIATCSNTSCDPWTNSTAAGTVLNDFTDWGNSGGFGVTYDVATLWTGRNFNGGTIGIAWLSGVCNNLRYNCCENFSSNSQTLRVLWSHELGHNFSSQHDASGTFIMSPSVNTSTTWSTASQNSINNFVASRNCLSFCSSAAPPTAFIEAAFEEACTESFLAFFDESEGNVTDRTWDFPGGTPSFTTDAHPIVYYDAPGFYTASLSVENSQGSDFAEFMFEVDLNDNYRKVISYTNFEDGFGDWFVENPDNDITWTITNVDGNNGDQAAFLNNFDYNDSGETDALVSQFLDFTSQGDPRLSFEYAYAQFNNGTQDILRVFVSTDGGSSFPDLVFEGNETGGGNFATTNDRNSAFFPQNSGEWCDNSPTCIDIDLSAYAGLSDIVIKIENETDFGNNMFVDNIAITTSCGAVDPPIAAFSQDIEIGCAPLFVSFEDESTGSVEFREWTFDGGSPDFSNDEFPFSEYAVPGVYDVILYVENGAGSDVITSVGAVTVLGLPTPAYTFTNTGLTYQFMNTSSADATDFAWDFDDGTFSPEENPEHTFPGPGTYNVVLQVFNDCGDEEIVQTIVVDAVLTAGFSSDETQGCADFIVQFTDESIGDPETWSWTFAGGTPATSDQQNPVITYSTSGVYDVSLTVTADGLTETITRTEYITVFDLPTASFTATLTPGDDTPTIVNNSTDADSYSWDFGNGEMSTMENPTVTYDEPGTYVITLTVTNECGTDMTTQTVDVIFPPEDPIIDVGNTNGCAPYTVMFFANPVADGQTYAWDFEGGTPATSTEVTPTVTYNSPGTFDVTLTITNAAGSSSTTEVDFITVGIAPTAGFTATATPGSLTVTLDDMSSDGTTTSWDLGNGFMTTDNITSYTYDEAGTYTITQTVTNECGTDVATQTVTIVTNPDSPIIDVDNTSGCTPFTANFFANPVEDGQTYAWEFEGGSPATSTEINPTITYNTPGTFDVTLTITNAAGSNTTTETDLITVGEAPLAGFTATATPGSLTVLLEDMSTGGTSVSWDLGNGFITMDDIMSYTYAAAGTYTITQTVTNECGTDMATQTITLILPPDAPIIDVANTSGCAPYTAMFFANPVAPGQTYAWEFEGGTPATSTETNPTVTFNTAGTFDVTLTITNVAGSSTTTETDYITVGAAPTAAFTATTTAGSLTVMLDDMSTGAGTTTWDLGNGFVTTDDITSYTYANAGTYTITQTVTNECGTDMATQTITLVQPVTPMITASVTEGCSPLTVTFTAQPQDPSYTYAWSFVGAAPTSATTAEATAIYNTPGTYSVMLTITNAAGSSTTTETDLIVVEQGPIASFTFTSTPGSPVVNFMNNSEFEDNVQWFFGDGMTSVAENPDHNYDDEGTYEVMLVAANDCGTDTVRQMVDIIFLPEPSITVSTTSGCAPLSVTYEAAPQEAGNTFAWDFPGGDPMTSTEAVVTVVYTEPGSYNATLTVTNAAGSGSTELITPITVLDGPMVSFNIDYEVGSFTATFTSTSQGVDELGWNFGDGNIATGAEVTHTYATAGNYEVTLTGTGPCGTESITQTIMVVVAPTGGFTETANSGCAPFMTTFMANDQGEGFTYSWVFEGGTPGSSNEANPTVTYDTPGTYAVTYAVTNAAGTATESEPDYITVLDTPVAGFTFMVNGLTTSFTSTSTGATSFLWTFMDGMTSDLENPSFVFPAAGSYDVTLVVTNDCGSDETTMTVEIVGAAPVVSFTAENTEGCAPVTVSYMNTSEDAVSLMWMFPGGTPATSIEENPMVTYDTPGTYNATLTAMNVFGTTAVTQLDVVTVFDATVANFTFTLDGTTATFSSTSTEATELLWTFPSGMTSTEDNPMYTFPGNGTFDVLLAATGPCNEDDIILQVTIDGPAPTVSFTTDTEAGCAPLTVTYTDTSTDDPTGWNWNFEGGTPATGTEQTMTVIYDTPGTYGVGLSVTNIYGTSDLTVTDYVVVEAAPGMPEFTIATDDEMTYTFTVDNPVAGWSYSWAFGDGDFADGTMAEHTYLADGPFEVSLIVTNDCGSSTSMKTVNPIISSVDTPAWAFDLILAPNPTSDQLFLRATNWPTNGELSFRLVNALGQELRLDDRSVNTGNWQEPLDLSRYPAGTYWLQISWSGEVWTQKVIKL